MHPNLINCVKHDPDNIAPKYQIPKVAYLKRTQGISSSKKDLLRLNQAQRPESVEKYP